MKIIILICSILIIVFARNNYKIDDFKKSRFAGVENPDQPGAASMGGDNGEFLRRNQPQEHIIVPLINILEAEYNPLFMDIKKFRKKELETDKGIEYRMKEDKELDARMKNLLSK